MCALPLSKVLPQRKSNSLDAERETFERSQVSYYTEKLTTGECSTPSSELLWYVSIMQNELH